MAPNAPKTMNVSLPPQLFQAVKERVESGAYTSASEVVREALRLLDAVVSLREGTEGKGAKGKLSKAQWKELRRRLVRGETKLQRERVREIDELFLSGVMLMRKRLKKEMPEASDEKIDIALAQWLRERAGEDVGEMNGQWFKPVSKERFERIARGG